MHLWGEGGNNNSTPTPPHPGYFGVLSGEATFIAVVPPHVIES